MQGQEHEREISAWGVVADKNNLFIFMLPIGHSIAKSVQDSAIQLHCKYLLCFFCCVLSRFFFSYDAYE